MNEIQSSTPYDDANQIRRIARVTAAYIRTYSDTGQTSACVKWIDVRGRPGIAEGDVTSHCPYCKQTMSNTNGLSPHMKALFDRACLDGITTIYQER
jgi:hypothetical protein